MKSFTLATLVLLGASLRLLVQKYASQGFLRSFTYSSMDQWEAVQEGVFLRSVGLSLYDNDIVHQPPLALRFWSTIVSNSKERTLSYFLMMDLLMTGSLLVLCSVCTDKLMRSDRLTEECVHATSKDMLLSGKDFALSRILVICCYCFNPYSILAFASQSTSVLWNVVCVWTMIALFQDWILLSSFLCAIGCYLRLYPCYLMLPVMAAALMNNGGGSPGFVRRLFRVTCSLSIFFATLACLLWASYLAEGRSWAFIHATYLHQLFFRDCTPHLGLYWYLFVEMFEHFHELFIYVFHLLLATLVVALTLRFHYNIPYLTFVTALIANVLQPYSSIGEFGYLLSLLPIWSYLHKYSRLSLPVPCVLLSSLILTPLFHYAWLNSGTANANFYFATSMAHAVGQILLITDLLNSFVKREYFLRVGPKLELSSGQKLILIHS